MTARGQGQALSLHGPPLGCYQPIAPLREPNFLIIPLDFGILRKKWFGDAYGNRSSRLAIDGGPQLGGVEGVGARRRILHHDGVGRDLPSFFFKE